MNKNTFPTFICLYKCNTLRCKFNKHNSVKIFDFHFYLNSAFFDHFVDLKLLLKKKYSAFLEDVYGGSINESVGMLACWLNPA